MNKLQKSLLIIFAFVTAFLAPSAMNAQTNGNWIDQRETTWGADYESTDEFTINTAGQLAQLAYMVNNGNSFEYKTITLTGNIDLAGHYWTPIGNGDKDFRGSFEGGNKTISNLTINTTDSYQGLFGSLASAFVMNVNLVGCNITAGSSTGGIAGDAGWTTISNCSVSGEIHSAGTSYHNYGGIVGTVSGSSYGNLIIVGNTNTASVSATADGYAVGGIVGYFGRTTKFRNNFSTGVVSGSSYVGTLIGMIDEDDYNEFTNNCYPATATNLTGAVGSGDTSTGHDIEGASVGFTISAGEGVTLSLPTPVKTYNNVNYYMSGTVVNTTACTVPDGYHFTGYTVNSGSISDANLMIGSHTLTEVTDNVTISGSYAEGDPTDFSELISIEVENATYDGQAHLQEPVVTMGETVLTKNIDYSVSYSGECINAGQYTLTITGNGSYTGSKNATFNILPYDITNSDEITVRISIDQTAEGYYVAYTGDDITIDPYNIQIRKGWNYLSYPTEYTFSTNPSPLHDIGAYTLNINGAGNYTGSREFPLHVVYGAPMILPNITTTATTATISWYDDNNPSSYTVEYGTLDYYSFDNPYIVIGTETTSQTSITLENLTPETQYYARVKGIYGEGQESGWSRPASFMPSIMTTIGEQDDASEYLPTNTTTNYSVSQQIYTVAEIGKAGAILKIDFMADSWMPTIRTLDIYMVHTQITSFSGNDWITVSNSDKVFSGDVNFMTTDPTSYWSTISLTSPFLYNGDDNLAIIIHDKTGSAGGYYGVEFGSFSTDNNQAIYISGNDEIDLSSLGEGTSVDMKNCIQLMFGKVFTTDGNWNEASNWNPSGVPSNIDPVVIKAVATIPDDYTAQYLKITIADGGQLITNNAVEATVQKNIGAWTTNPVGGWYFIASPIADDLMPKFVENMLTYETEAPYSFDLYRLNGTTWENYHLHNGNSENPAPGGLIPINPYEPEEPSEAFYLENGMGYLYANASDVTLEFTGSTKPYTAGYTVEANSWNLVGNPYTFNAYVNQPHYVLNSARTAIVAAESNSAAIAPCTGVIVNGNATFYNNVPQTQSNNQGNIQVTLAQTVVTRGSSNVETIDNAILSFNEGCELGKFYFGTQNANLYIPQGTEEYAIVSSEAQGEMPVSFRANENGQYTLTVNPENVEMGYLHLIDNKTGADIDLLATPSYSFEAKTTDFESRFRLVFSANSNETESDSFAFFSNGQLIINNNGQATLQVIDLTGRLLSSETINGTCSTTLNAPAGVYMIRLVNGENVKVQKIVVR